MIAEHREREAPAAARAPSPRPRRRAALASGAGRPARRTPTARRSARRTAPPPCRAPPRSARGRCPTATASANRQPRARLQEHEPAVERRTTGGRPASRARSSSPRRRARATTRIQYSAAEPSNRSSWIGPRSASATTRKQRARSARLDQQRRAQRVVVLEARARGGRRSCARAAARSAGRSPRRSRTAPTTAARSACSRRRRATCDATREVRERDDARWWRCRPTGCGRRGRSRTPVAPAAAGRAALRAGRAAWSTGTASAPRRPRRGAPAARTNARLDQWLTCPGVLPRSLR